jgi:hypothetical protein
MGRAYIATGTGSDLPRHVTQVTYGVGVHGMHSDVWYFLSQYTEVTHMDM